MEHNSTQSLIVPFRLMTDGFVACWVIKMRENSLSGSVNLFKGVNVIDVRTKWFQNFRRFELSRVNFVPREPKIGSSYREFREIGGEITKLEWSKSKGNKVWFKILGGLRNRGFEKSGFHCILNNENFKMDIEQMNFATHLIITLQ